MGSHLRRDLDSLQKSLMSMCALVEEMLHEAVDHLQRPSPELMSRLAAYEDQIDQWDVQIENNCLKTLALHQPVATDLRRVAAVLKISGELERVADFGVNLSERALDLAKGPPLEVPPKLHRMARLATEMLQQSIDAFVNLDVELARSVCARDDEVDRLNVEIIGELISQMERFPHLVRPAMHLFSASRYIERVGDHATNIAEDVVFLVEGQIIRHQGRPA